MVKENKILVFIIGFICAWILFSVYSKNAVSQNTLSPNVSFSGQSNVIYFLDRGESKLYRYNVQGRLTATYTIRELGKDLKKN